MDISKRFDRILKLFFVLQSKSVVTIGELQSRFETSKRTIYRDLKALETAGVPIASDNGSGYYIPEGFRIQPSRFTQHEVLSLLIAEKMMEQHQTRFIKEQFESLLTKVKSSLQGQQKMALEDLGDKLQINPEVTPGTYLPDIINTLLSSISTHQIIKMNYQNSGETTSKVREIEPVGLYYEREFWYVLAFCHVPRDYRRFRLDRINSASVLDIPFTRKHLSLSELREEMEATPGVAIKIKADLKFAHYMLWEREGYGFIQEETIGDYVLMEFNCVQHPTAFVRWFLTFADVAEIVEPEFLRDELREILRSGLERNN